MSSSLEAFPSWIPGRYCPQDALGLTRSKCGYGIRVATEKYDATKKSLFPDAAQSSESDNGGASRFHLLGVPPTVDRSALKVALRALKWQVRVSCSSGFKPWVVFSDMVPPTRSFPLAGDTVVVIESSGNGSGPVVASSGKKNQGLALKVSPVSPVAPADVSTEVSSKFDQLAKQADQKVIDLEAKVQSLSTKIDDQQEKNDTRFTDIESQVKGVGEQVKQQSTDLDAKLEGMFGKLLANQQSYFEKMEKDSELAITALRTEYQTGYTELKEILSQSPTAKRERLPVHSFKLPWGSRIPLLCWERVQSLNLGVLILFVFRRLVIQRRLSRRCLMSFVLVVAPCLFPTLFLTNLRLWIPVAAIVGFPAGLP